MSQIKDLYRISPVQHIEDLTSQVNRLLARLADRLDKIEGYRGTPEFHADVNMLNNRITGLLASVDGSDAINQDELATPTITDFTNATHDHEDASGGGTIDHSKLTSLTAATSGHTGYELTANKETGDTLTDSTTKYPSSHTVAEAIAAAGGGDWTDDGDSWTYASSATFTVSGDVRSRFPIGSKLSWVQSSAERQGYVVATSYGSPNTTVTVAGNTVLNSAISAQKYSYASSPTGFVHWFDYSETWTGFSSAPSGGICRFKIEGRLATLQLMRTTHGTSNSSSITVTLPVTASSVTNYKLYGPGCAYDNGAYQAHFGVYGISAGGTTATLYKNTDGSSAWTSSGNKNWNGLIIWEI